MNGFALRLVVLLAVIAVGTGVGLVLRRRAGVARDVPHGEILLPADLGEPGAVGTVTLGERATFVQFSSPACGPCRSVRRVLGELVTSEPGVAHVDIDATERLDLARRFDIMRTPTVLLLDPAGRVISRMSGGLSAEQAHAVLNPSFGSS